MLLKIKQFIFIFSVAFLSAFAVDCIAKQILNAEEAASFSGSEVLGRPGTSNITVSLLSDNDITFYYTYGTVSGNLNKQTTTDTALKSKPVLVEINGLSANTRYYYQLNYKTSGMLLTQDR